MKKTLTSLLLLLTVSCFAQTANQFSLAAFQQKPSYSTNTGYYRDSSHFNTDSLTSIIKKLGGMNVRIKMPDDIVSQYGGGFGSDMAMYASKGFTNMTAFLGNVWTPNRLNVTFPGCSQNSWVWINEYDSIYHFNNTINTNNKFAYFVYLAIHNYKSQVKVWEIINEMLICSSNANVNPANSNYWGTHIPRAQDLPNMLAPLPYCIRLLRIAWTVMKAEDPSAHIGVGGLISVNDIKVLDTYTDNPGAGDTSHAGSGAAGSVTADYPLTGGAYYDVIIEHIYPQFSKANFGNNCNFYGEYNGNEHSDYALGIFQAQQNGFDSVSAAFGYNNSTYPKKWKAITEVDVPNTNAYGFYGSDSMALNFHIKMSLKAQQDSFLNTYTYALGDYEPTTAYFSNQGFCGDLMRAGLTVNTVVKKRKYYANLTMSTLLYNNYFYDAAKTAVLGLSGNVDGVAMKNASGNYVYILWAKTTTARVEAVSASYTFPFTISGSRREWNWSQTNLSTAFGQIVVVNSTPSLFFPAAVVVAIKANAGNDTTINVGGTVILRGSANVVATYNWADSTGKVIGVTQSMVLSGLKVGSYTYKLTVKDSTGLTATDMVVVTVVDPNPIIRYFKGDVRKDGTIELQ